MVITQSNDAPGQRIDPPGVLGQRDGILLHSWTPTSQAASASWLGPRTRLFTYVLSGDAGGNEGGGGATRVRARQALNALLGEIQASQRALSITEAGLLQRANQFVLPARRYDKGVFTLDHYDFALAAGYLNRFRLALPESDLEARLGRLGPFMLATRKPLAEIIKQGADGVLVVDTQSPMLLVDMTDAHPMAMPAYVNCFKDAVRAALPNETTAMRPLRAEFASAVLKTNEALPFVAEAYAGTRKLLEPPVGGGGGGAPR